MKKTALILLVIFVLCLSFVGCKTKTLAPPSNLQVEDGILSWDKVEDATEYLVLVNSDEYKVTSPFLELSLQNNKDYEIRVKALSSGKLKDSDFSETLIYSNKVSSGLKRLNAPNLMEIDGLGNVYWTLVSNSIGYKIFKNNILYATINDPYTTSYLLDITDMGTYSIQVQAIGDNENYSDSAKSNVYKLVINPDGNPNLPSLSAPKITYNPTTESLEWSSVRNAQEYFVYLNDTVVESVLSNGKSEYSCRIYPNLTTNAFTVVAVGDNVSYGMSKKSNSISFPLVPAEPPTNLRVEVIDGTPTIIWDEVEYSRGYILEINSKQEKLLTNTFNLNQYEDGEYRIRVMANGDNLFYTSTTFSPQILVTVSNGAIEKPQLSAPERLRYSNNVLLWDKVDNADEYRIIVETPYDDTVSTLYFTTKETSFVMDSVFDETVLIFYVCAYGEGYTQSLFSRGLGYVPSATKQYLDENGELVTIQGEQYYFANSPTDITYDGRILSWSNVDDSIGYVVNIDGQTYFSETNSFEYSINGKIVVSVSTLTETENYYTSPKSVETLIVSPKLLEAPVITLDKTLLSWDGVLGAGEYILFANGEQITVAGNFVDLKSVLKIDGTYLLSLVAVSGDSVVYSDSLKSNELSFVVDYGEYGTEEKPYLITSYEDFALMQEYPDAYFKIDVSEIDLGNATISPLFDEMHFIGTLNGNGAVIKNFRINSTNLASGFFGTLGSAEIYNLSFENATVLNGVNVGVISHSATNTTVLDVNIRNSLIILSETANTVGGAFGTFNGTARNISVDIRIIKSEIDYSKSTLRYVGGFGGIVEGELENITLSGIIETTQNNVVSAGFLSGELKGSVKGLTATSVKLISYAQYNGLISGIAQADLTNVNASGILESSGAYNGLFGSFKGGFDGTATLDINVLSSSTARVGGFSGYLSDSTVNIDLTSKITVSCGFALVGGVAGDVYGNIEYVFGNEIDITVNTNTGYIGGVFGRIFSEDDGSVSGKIEINVDTDKTVNVLVGSFKGTDSNNCIDSEVELTGNITEYLSIESSGEENEE